MTPMPDPPSPIEAQLPDAQTRLDHRQLATLVANNLENKVTQLGDPQVSFELAARLKDLIRQYDAKAPRKALGWSDLETIDHICSKLARITCCSNAQQFWLDIAALALVGAHGAEKPL